MACCVPRGFRTHPQSLGMDKILCQIPTTMSCLVVCCHCIPGGLLMATRAATAIKIRRFAIVGDDFEGLGCIPYAGNTSNAYRLQFTLLSPPALAKSTIQVGGA